MRFRPRTSRRRHRLWSWRTLRRLYQAQGLRLPDGELDGLSQEVARELNRLDDQAYYNDWKFAERHRLDGLHTGEADDPLRTDPGSD